MAGNDSISELGNGKSTKSDFGYSLLIKYDLHLDSILVKSFSKPIDVRCEVGSALGHAVSDGISSTYAGFGKGESLLNKCQYYQ